MQVLNKIQEDNLGGVLNLWMAPAYNIDTITKDSSTGIYSVTFEDEDKNWLIYLTPETSIYTEKEDISSGSSFYTCTFDGFIPNDSPELRLQLNELKARPWIIFFEDQNEYMKMAGEINCPLQFSHQYTTRQRISELKGHDIKLQGNTLLGSVFINNPF